MPERSHPPADSFPGPERPSAGRRAEEVEAYLLDHPDFLAERPELLRRLRGPRPDASGPVVDLQTFLVSRLRREVDTLKRQQRALVTTSRTNNQVQNRIHSAILFLLDAESFEALIHTISTDLAVLLDLDVVCLLIEAERGVEPSVADSGLRLVDIGSVDRWLDGREHLLEGAISGSPEIFGAAAGLVRSQALIRLDVSSETPPCMVALGSREPDMFREGMRTELMSFLARVLERCIRSWLDVSRA